jgi:hypothetical protein
LAARLFHDVRTVEFDDAGAPASPQGAYPISAARKQIDRHQIRAQTKMLWIA